MINSKGRRSQRKDSPLLEIERYGKREGPKLQKKRKNGLMASIKC